MAGKKKQKKNRAEERQPGTSSVSIKRFALTYLLLMGGAFLLIGLKPLQEIVDINGLYTKGVVALTTGILDMAGVPCSSHGSIIQLPSLFLDVRFGCNGLEAVMIYSVAVIAFPSPWQRKAAGILWGFLVIQAINIVRIAALAYVAVYLNGHFEFIHIYIAQGMMIAVSLGIFFVYLHYANRFTTVRQKNGL